MWVCTSPNTATERVNRIFQMKVSFVGPHAPSTFILELNSFKKPQRKKFVDYLVYLVRAVALATFYRDSSVRPFKESFESWNKVGQQMLQYAKHCCCRWFMICLPSHHPLPVLQHTFVLFLTELPMFPLLQISL
ncbi:hypothetical protein TNCV_3732911 [Trichonephila clavipes]|nr:hypothetical protein TNCV_3732911 [Trichonephila clavipes]